MLCGHPGSISVGSHAVLAVPHYDARVDQDSQRAPDIRIGNPAREAAIAALGSALREGRFDLPEFERRAAVVHAARIQSELDPVLADLPRQRGQTGAALRTSRADRDQALAQLAEALTDGRIDAAEYANAEALLRRPAVTYADIDAVVGGLETRASLAERTDAIKRIEAAASAGLLDPSEKATRIAAAQTAANDAQLTALTADLARSGPATTAASQDHHRRVTHTEREQVAARLQAALGDGQLDLAEFDERVRVAYAAKVYADLARIVADLPPPPPPPLRKGIRRLFSWLLPDEPPTPDEPTAPNQPTEQADIDGIPALPRYSQYGTSGLEAALADRNLATPRPQPEPTGCPVPPQHNRPKPQETVTPPPPHEPTSSATAAAVSSRKKAKKRTPPENTAAPATQHPKPPRRDSFPLQGETGEVKAIACLVLPDGVPVAVTGSDNNTATVWDLRDGTPRHVLSGHTRDVVGVGALTLPDGVPIAMTLGEDGKTRVWDLRDGSLHRVQLSRRFKEPAALQCLTLADGTPAALIGTASGAHLWDFQVTPHLRQVNDFHHGVTSLAAMVTPDGVPLTVLVAFDAVQLHQLDDGAAPRPLDGHKDGISGVACGVLPDGTPIAVTVSIDETALVWDLNRGAKRRRFTSADGWAAVTLVTLPDGTPVAVMGGYTEKVQLWDLRDGSSRAKLDTNATIIGGLTLPDRAIIVTADMWDNVVYTFY